MSLFVLGDRRADARFIIESRVYGNDLQWYLAMACWPEVLPSTGGSSPRRGLGAFVNASNTLVPLLSTRDATCTRCSCASLALSMTSMSVQPMFLYSQPLARAALAELSAGFQKYTKGLADLVVIFILVMVRMEIPSLKQVFASCMISAPTTLSPL